jgi:hypothetical protein
MTCNDVSQFSTQASGFQGVNFSNQDGVRYDVDEHGKGFSASSRVPFLRGA